MDDGPAPGRRGAAEILRQRPEEHADPTTSGIVGAVLAIATVLVPSAAGRMLAIRGRVVAPVLAAGVVGIAGFIGTALVVLPNILLLC